MTVTAHPRGILTLLALVAALALLGTRAAAADAAQYAYAALLNGGIAQYSIGAGGVLVPLSPANVAAGAQELSIAVTPDARHVYAGDNTTRLIDEFAVGAGGTLSALGSVPLRNSSIAPTSLAVSPDGTSLYVADSGSNAEVDAFTIAPDGTLSPKSPFETGLPALTAPDALAVSPDGTTLFVAARSLGGELFSFPIGPGGVLGTWTTNLGTDPLSATTRPAAIVVSPNGRSVYVTGPEMSSSNESAVSQFSVGAGGAITPDTPLTVSIGTKAFAEGLAISPDGQHVYVAATIASSTVPAGVFRLDVGAGGLLTLAPTPPTLFGGDLNGLAFTPDGSSLYTSDFASGVYALSVGQGGGLAPKTPFESTVGAAYAIAVSPDQAPVAAFGATPGAAGSPTVLDATASSASSGAPAAYAWSFGDGTSATSPGPIAVHTFAAAGSYPVTLTVTDGAGCSTSLVFTGQTAYCNGGASAVVTHTVTVAGATSAAGPSVAPVISAASVSHARFRVGAQATALAARARPPVGTAFRLTLSAPASLRVVIAHAAPGLRGARGCVAPTSALRRRHAAHCSRTVTDGTLTRASEPAGPLSIPFSGRVGAHALRPGLHSATLSASDAAGSSAPVRLAFTVVR